MSHLDVVPVEDAGQWRYPPFGGVIAEGRLWGRGASDMKSTVAAEAMALIILKRAGVRFNGELAFLASADEESGSAYGCGWLVQHFPELIRADYRGQRRRPMAHCTPRPGRCSTRSAPAKRVAWKPASTSPAAATTLRSPGGPTTRSTSPTTCSGASAPTSRRYRCEPICSATSKHWPAISEPVTLENIERIIPTLDESMYLASYLRAASRMTLVASMLQAGVKSNSVAENARSPATYARCRTRPDVRPARDREDAAGIAGVQIEVIEMAASNASPFDHPFADQVMAATRPPWAATTCTSLPASTSASPTRTSPARWAPSPTGSCPATRIPTPAWPAAQHQRIGRSALDPQRHPLLRRPGLGDGGGEGLGVREVVEEIVALSTTPSPEPLVPNPSPLAPSP